MALAGRGVLKGAGRQRRSGDARRNQMQAAAADVQFAPGKELISPVLRSCVVWGQLMEDRATLRISSQVRARERVYACQRERERERARACRETEQRDPKRAQREPHAVIL
eukprot:2838916-Rhodomonas_salina.1